MPNWLQIIITGLGGVEDVKVKTEEIIQIRIECLRQMEVLGTKLNRVFFLVILHSFQINVTNVRDKQLMEDILVNTIGQSMWMVHA